MEVLEEGVLSLVVAVAGGVGNEPKKSAVASSIESMNAPVRA
jgi:hypothetical protein